MAEQKQDDQLEPTYSSYVGIRDVALKTRRRRWTIGRSGERASGISVQVAWHDDDDDIISNYNTIKQNFWSFFFTAITCGTVVNHSSVISTSKKGGWFYIGLQHYKQIMCGRLVY